MQKCIIFSLLTLSLIGFIVSCKKDNVTQNPVPLERILTEADLAEYNPLVVINSDAFAAETGAVEERTCCAADYTAYQTFRVNKRPLNSRFRWEFKDYSTRESVVGLNYSLPGCTSILLYFNFQVMACQYFPESNGPFSLEMASQNYVPATDMYSTCDSGSSPVFWLPPASCQ